MTYNTRIFQLIDGIDLGENSVKALMGGNILLVPSDGTLQS